MKYIKIEEQESLFKTKVFRVININADLAIADIKWYSPWRQYCFFPYYNSVYSKGCLEDINNFIQQLMNKRRKDKEASHE